MKPTILLYSDCPVFGGADILAATLLKNEALQARFELRFAYRKNPSFSAGVARRIPPSIPAIPVALSDRLDWIEGMERRVESGFIRKICKLAFRIVEPALFLLDLFVLWRVFVRERPALIHVNNGGYPGALGCRAAAIAGWLVGAKVVFVVHSEALALRPWEAFDRLLVDPWVGRSIDTFVTASKIAQNFLRERRFPIAKMHLIPDGVAAPTSLRPAADVRRELGLRDDEVVFVKLAFFEPRKGHAVLVDALRELATAAQPAPFRIVFIGDGPQKDAIERACRESGLSPRCLFLGYRGDASDIVNACDALILSSIASEDMPLAILDAMALSKPVIASRLAAIPEEVSDGKSGLLVEPGSARQLAAAISRLLGSAELRREMGQEGRRRFLEQFEAGIVCGRYGELYQSMIAGAH